MAAVALSRSSLCFLYANMQIRHTVAKANARRGFTLMEIVVALAVLGTMAAGCFAGFNAINTYSISSRLYSEAQTCAQNQIDLILSKDPFDVTTNIVPTVLGGQALAANASTTVTTPNVFIYQDPVTGNVVVTGTMTTTITNTSSTMNFTGTSQDLNIYRATVTVSYSFRGTNYNVSMDTMRTADR
jgi:prepilin-type N-terminal cleavage/methylation domain-containing protein